MPQRKYIPAKGDIVMVQVRTRPKQWHIVWTYFGRVREVIKKSHIFLITESPYHEHSWCWDDKSVKVTRFVEDK